MDKTVKVLQKIIPKELDILKRRFDILNGIQLYQPIGRRSLSIKLGISEKIIRTDTEYLKREGYILVKPIGMELTQSGNKILDELKNFIKHLDGITTIEEKVQQILGCKKVVIVSGNIDENIDVKKIIGKTAAKELLKSISNNSIIALAGGTTVGSVVEELKSTNLNCKNSLVVPARGSLGNKVEFQANTLVSKLATKIQADYRLLNIPDNLSQKALESVRQEPDIQSTISYILKSTILLFGIGNADVMAKRRNLDETTIDYLKENKAVAETLGYYFNKDGDVIFSSRSIGIHMDELKNLVCPIAVAGGRSKAEAIIAVRRLLNNACLVIDEGAANGIIELQ